MNTQYKQTVLQQIFDTATDLQSLVESCNDELPKFNAEPLQKEIAFLIWQLQRESSSNGYDPLTRSTNLYGKDEWITPDQIIKE